MPRIGNTAERNGRTRADGGIINYRSRWKRDGIRIGGAAPGRCYGFGQKINGIYRGLNCRVG